MVRSKRTHALGNTSDFPRLLGGRLCLHFVNTIEGRRDPQPTDYLTIYPALARWGYHVGAYDGPTADALRRAAKRAPREAAGVVRRARQQRDASYRAFRHIARAEEPADADIAELGNAYAAAIAHARLTSAGWTWDLRPPELALPLWLVAESAIDLVINGDYRRIRECPPGTGGCGWLFYDTSRNGTRRWCSMEGCGSKVKMRRQYARKKGNIRTN